MPSDPSLAALLALQHGAGNAAVGRAIARQPTGAPPLPARPPAAPAADVVQDALKQLRASGDVLDRNTAEAIDAGRMSVRYLQDLKVDPDNDALLDGWGFDKTILQVLLCPNGERRVIQKNAEGTAHDDCGTEWLFVSRNVTVTRMRELLVHETNHAMRLDEGPRPAADSFDRYKDEFQAYFISEYRKVADLDDRARQVRAHILRDYAAIAARYKTDAAFKTLVDGHKRPDANTLNSVRWRAIQEAAAGLGTDEEAIFEAIRHMSLAERAAARADPNFTAILNDELSGDELQRAQLLLSGVSINTEHAMDAMSGLGTDEAALFAALEAMDAAERATVRMNAGFMAQIRDELSGKELERARKILGGDL